MIFFHKLHISGYMYSKSAIKYIYGSTQNGGFFFSLSRSESVQRRKGEKRNGKRRLPYSKIIVQLKIKRFKDCRKMNKRI